MMEGAEEERGTKNLFVLRFLRIGGSVELFLSLIDKKRKAWADLEVRHYH